MKKSIVVLDGYTLNPGDLSWEALESLGDCQIYDRSAPDEVVDRAEEAAIVLTNKTPLPSEVLADLPKLEYIGVLATGFNIVDVGAAKARNIPVTNVPTYGTRSVAQMTMALLLELTQRVGDHASSVRQGDWMRSPDFCYWKHPLIELDGLTLGIVGYGRIGQAVASLAQAFGMHVVAYTRSPDQLPNNVPSVDLETLLQKSDVVSLHCPLTEQTHNLINAQRLELMKPTALLINTSRGPLVDERSLADALMQHRIAGAALDVLELEPPRSESLLYQAPNCFITPHIAWATKAARGRLLATAIENVQAFLNGAAQNQVYH